MVAMAVLCKTIRHTHLLVYLAGGVEESKNLPGRRFYGVVDLV
jgi:hypothetical protein